MELSLPKGCSPALFLPTSFSPSTFEPILHSTYISLAPTFEPIILSSRPMVVDPNPPTISCKTIFNQHAHQHHKIYQDKAKAKDHSLSSQSTSSSQPLPSFDQTMHVTLEEAKQGNTLYMDKHDDSLCILNSINLDMEDTLYDKHVSMDEKLIDNDFLNMFST